MKEWVAEQVHKQTQLPLKKLVLSEILQHLILQSLSRHGAFKVLVFTGGTALRILYQTGRYSEDLDFSQTRVTGVKFSDWIEKIHMDLAAQQFPFEAYLKEEKTVARADLRFSGILKEFQISPLGGQKLTIKLEVDNRPPAGGVTEVMLVTSPVSYSVVAFDLSSLFATKLHALFFRRYAKGRDYYDLMWYLGKGIRPNFKLFNNAIRQTQGAGEEIRQGDFKKRLLEHLESVDFSKVRAEVERFLIRPEESKLLSFEQVKSLLRHYD